MLMNKLKLVSHRLPHDFCRGAFLTARWLYPTDRRAMQWSIDDFGFVNVRMLLKTHLEYWKSSNNLATAWDTQTSHMCSVFICTELIRPEDGGVGAVVLYVIAPVLHTQLPVLGRHALQPVRRRRVTCSPKPSETANQMLATHTFIQFQF